MSDLPLYWTDPGLMEVTAAVCAAEPVENGWKLVLDRHLFYPGGGGQPADTGFVDNCPISRISRSGSGIQIEISGGRTYSAGDDVHCAVDSRFRNDSRQQHSGQHLLSAALSLEGLETVSVHLGNDYTGIEVSADSKKSISEELIGRVLGICDRWIGENRNIHSRYLSQEELDGLELRRSLSDKTEPGRTGPIRIIEIEDVDRVGCGGVHLENTSGIGLILFTGAEKIRGHYRLNWLIGNRASEHARFLNRQSRIVQNLLSVETGEISGRINSILEENRTSRLSLKKTEKEYGALLAERWIVENTPPDIIVERISGSGDRLEGALDSIRESELERAFLISGEDKSSEFFWILFDTGMKNIDFSRFKSEFLAEFHGNGGGSTPVWRGKLKGAPEDIVTGFQNWSDGKVRNGN